MNAGKYSYLHYPWWAAQPQNCLLIDRKEFLYAPKEATPDTANLVREDPLLRIQSIHFSDRILLSLIRRSWQVLPSFFSSDEQEMATSLTSGGALVCAVGCLTADRFGHRWPIWGACLLFMIGTVLCAFQLVNLRLEGLS